MDALQIVLHFYQMLSSLGAINFCSPTKGLAQELLSPITSKPCLHVPAIIAFFLCSYNIALIEFVLRLGTFYYVEEYRWIEMCKF